MTTKLFERFEKTKEDGFRREFILPLLTRLGFVGISSEHGVHEFGKDFVFSELDRFGQLRHMTVQAKHERRINQGKKVDDLLSQIRQAFFVHYRLASSPTEERRVSSVYVFNTGNITDNAKTQLVHALPKEMAANTFFFSGDQLEAINSTTYMQSTQQIRRRLVALQNQLALNILGWERHLSATSKPTKDARWNARGSLLHGTEEFLSEPSIPDDELHENLLQVWQCSQTITAIIHKFTNQRPTERKFPMDVAVLRELSTKAIHNAESAIRCIRRALVRIPE